MLALRQVILKNTTNLQNSSKIARIVNVSSNLHGTYNEASCKEAPFQKKIFLLETHNSSYPLLDSQASLYFWIVQNFLIQIWPH